MQKDARVWAVESRWVLTEAVYFYMGLLKSQFIRELLWNVWYLDLLCFFILELPN